MTLFLGIDDTDMPDSPGTGRIARTVAARLSSMCTITGITRHQLYIHPDIPYTSHNSCAVIHCEGGNPEELFNLARKMLLDNHAEGSDPGLALANSASLDPSVSAFGMDAKRRVLTQEQARIIALSAGVRLEGLAGTRGGIIGALAGIGLASTGNDGRFVLKARLRDLKGIQEAATLLQRGVDMIRTTEGASVTEGSIRFRKFPKPALVGGKAVLFVEPGDGCYEEVIRG